jgi:hypothetical protein
MNGLTLDDVIRITGRVISPGALGNALRRLPARFHSRDLELFRPVVPAILAALAMVDEEDGRDEAVANAVDFVHADPASWARVVHDVQSGSEFDPRSYRGGPVTDTTMSFVEQKLASGTLPPDLVPAYQDALARLRGQAPATPGELKEQAGNAREVGENRCGLGPEEPAEAPISTPVSIRFIRGPALAVEHAGEVEGPDEEFREYQPDRAVEESRTPVRPGRPDRPADERERDRGDVQSDDHTGKNSHVPAHGDSLPSQPTPSMPSASFAAQGNEMNVRQLIQEHNAVCASPPVR